MLCSDGVPRKLGALNPAHAMRSLVFRCLIVLLSLALVGGNAHAQLHAGNPPHDQRCPETHGHAHGDASHHPDDKSNPGCCCDSLGCFWAINQTPDLSSSGPAFYGALIRFGDKTSFRPGRAFPPELGPPRSGTLS